MCMLKSPLMMNSCEVIAEIRRKLDILRRGYLKGCELLDDSRRRYIYIYIKNSGNSGGQFERW